MSAYKKHSGTSTPSPLYIRGVPYTNAAAKFWLALMRETRSDYPGSDAMALTASMDGLLQSDMLFPTLALEREIQRAEKTGRRESLAALIAECELFGLPGSVQLDVCSGTEIVSTRTLPCDCVDAEIFAYLLVWLLEWAEIPEREWNADQVSGSIPAGDAGRGVFMPWRVNLENTHLSEGLYRRRVSLAWECGEG